jgi:hypothetical protein
VVLAMALRTLAGRQRSGVLRFLAHALNACESMCGGTERQICRA